jgi:hypothetical protein
MQRDHSAPSSSDKQDSIWNWSKPYENCDRMSLFNPPGDGRSIEALRGANRLSIIAQDRLFTLHQSVQLLMKNYLNVRTLSLDIIIIIIIT